MYLPLIVFFACVVLEQVEFVPRMYLSNIGLKFNACTWPKNSNSKACPFWHRARFFWVWLL